MRVSSQLSKLKKKMKSERKHKQNHIVLPNEAIKVKFCEKRENDEKQKHKFLDDLDLFKNLLKMIENGASGFDLAYEVEKNQYVKKLIYDGILFYNTFLEIGNQKFIEAPDIRKKDYSHFKTVEQTEKQLFMMWLKEEIDERQTILKDGKKYKEYVKIRENLIQKYLFCENCGAKIKERYQYYCEKCGFKLN